MAKGTFELHKDICISSGNCVSTAPHTFVFDDDEEAELIPGGIELPDDLMREIVVNCPSGAIRIIDRD